MKLTKTICKCNSVNFGNWREFQGLTFHNFWQSHRFTQLTTTRWSWLNRREKHVKNEFWQSRHFTTPMFAIEHHLKTIIKCQKVSRNLKYFLWPSARFPIANRRRGPLSARRKPLRAIFTFIWPSLSPKKKCLIADCISRHSTRTGLIFLEQNCKPAAGGVRKTGRHCYTPTLCLKRFA